MMQRYKNKWYVPINDDYFSLFLIFLVLHHSLFYGQFLITNCQFPIFNYRLFMQ